MSLTPRGGRGRFPMGLPGRIPAICMGDMGMHAEYTCLNGFHQQLRVGQVEHRVRCMWLG